MVSFQLRCFIAGIMAEKGRQGKKDKETKEGKGDRWIARYDCPSLDLALNPCAILTSHPPNRAPCCLSTPYSLLAPTMGPTNHLLLPSFKDL